MMSKDRGAGPGILFGRRTNDLTRSDLRQHIQWSGGRRSHNPPHPILLGLVDNGAALADQVDEVANVHRASFGGEANRKCAKHIKKRRIGPGLPMTALGQTEKDSAEDFSSGFPP